MSKPTNEKDKKYHYSVDEKFLKKKEYLVRYGERNICVVFDQAKIIKSLIKVTNNIYDDLTSNYGRDLLEALNPAVWYDGPRKRKWLTYDESIAHYLNFINICLLYTTPQLMYEVVANAPKNEDGTLIKGEAQHLAYDGVGHKDCFYELCAVNADENRIELEIRRPDIDYDSLGKYKLGDRIRYYTCGELLDAHRDLPEDKMYVYKTDTKNFGEGDIFYDMDSKLLEKRELSVKVGDKVCRVVFPRAAINIMLDEMSEFECHCEYYFDVEDGINAYTKFIKVCLLYTTPQLMREVAVNAVRRKDGALRKGKVQNLVSDEYPCPYVLRAVNKQNDLIELEIVYGYDDEPPHCDDILESHKDLIDPSFEITKKEFPISTAEAFCIEELAQNFKQRGRATVKIPEGAKRIPDGAFYAHIPNIYDGDDECYGLDHDNRLYEYSKKIVGVTVPEGVEEIGDHAFAFCKKLSYVQLPSTLKKIGNYAFIGCINLKELQLPDSLTEIGHDAFYGVPAHIKIPESVYIGEYSFHEFSDDMPPQRSRDGLVSNGKEFFGCRGDNIENIIIPEGILSIPDGVSLGLNCREVTLPDSLVYIGSDALKGLKTIHHLPKSLRYIAPGALIGCESLGDLEPIFKKQPYHSQPIYIENGEVVDMDYHVTNGQLYRGNTLVGFVEEQPECMTIEPGTVEVDISSPYFVYSRYVGNVKKVVFPDSVKVIKNFNRFDYLKEVVLPEDLEIIESRCFSFCRIEEVYIPDSVKYIGDFCFCKMKGVYIPENEEFIRYGVETGDDFFIKTKICVSKKTRIANLKYLEKWLELDWRD